MGKVLTKLTGARNGTAKPTGARNARTLYPRAYARHFCQTAGARTLYPRAYARHFCQTAGTHTPFFLFQFAFSINWLYNTLKL